MALRLEAELCTLYARGLLQDLQLLGYPRNVVSCACNWGPHPNMHPAVQSVHLPERAHAGLDLTQQACEPQLGVGVADWLPSVISGTAQGGREPGQQTLI